MITFTAFLRAFAKPYTYDLRANSYLWLGFFWGLLVPFFTITSDLNSAGKGQGIPDLLRAHPVHFLFLAYPLILGVLFGAMGTVRHALEIENKRLIQTLSELAMTDPLTGLHNRRYVAEALKNMLEITRRTGRPLAVILIDLDGFKAVNDRHGHPRGDQVLCDAAAALRGALRQSDVLGRHGGDEFILLAPADATSAVELRERAVEAVRKATGLALSAGIGCWPEDGATADELVAAADRRLGTTKKKSQDSRTVDRVVPDAGGTS